MALTAPLRAELTQHLKDLHLPTIRECFPEQAEKARKEELAYERYLLELTRRECEVRTGNRITRLMRESRLPLEKTLATFDQKRLPGRVRQQVQVLLDGSFLDRHENVLAFGNPGSGKTHLLCAIGQELIQRGRRVLFTACSLLVQELLIAKRDLRLARVLKRFAGFDAILIDDIGYVQQNREEMEVLFALLADRYERGSVLLTSNLPFSRWEAIFKDPMTTAAAIDRLVHHSVILELNLGSYRLEASQKARGERRPTAGEPGTGTSNPVTSGSGDQAIVHPGAPQEVDLRARDTKTPGRPKAGVRTAATQRQAEREK